MRRVNAHGDEFNAVIGTPDGKYLLIATEKGTVLVWSIPEGRVVKRLSQPGPVHALVLTSQGRVIAAGGEHEKGGHTSVIRMWKFEQGTFEEWPAIQDESVVLLAANSAKSLVAGASASGTIVVWDSGTRTIIAKWNLGKAAIGLVLINRTAYVATADPNLPFDEQSNSLLTLAVDSPGDPPKQFVAPKEKQLWVQLSTDAGGSALAAGAVNTNTGATNLVVIDPASGSPRKTIDGLQARWVSSDKFVLFDGFKPQKTVSLASGDVTPWAGGGGFHGEGQPAEMVDLVAAADGMTAWGVYRKQSALVRWRADDGKGEILSTTPGNVYSMDVLTGSGGGGSLLTAGDDGFVRLWSLSDLSPQREFHVPFGVPQGVALLSDGRHAVFSYSASNAPTGIALADLESGGERQILNVEQPYAHVQAAGDRFVYEAGNRITLVNQSGAALREFTLSDKVVSFDISRNARWLAAADDKSVYLFDCDSGQQVQRIPAKYSNQHLAVTNDGKSVYVTNWPGEVHRWDVNGDVIKPLTSVRGVPSTLRLSSDEKQLVVGGNHRDVGIYDAVTGNALKDFETEAADFNVTNVWLKDGRLIFTTDAGVLFDTRVQP